MKVTLICSFQHCRRTCNLWLILRKKHVSDYGTVMCMIMQLGLDLKQRVYHMHFNCFLCTKTHLSQVSQKCLNAPLHVCRKQKCIPWLVITRPSQRNIWHRLHNYLLNSLQIMTQNEKSEKTHFYFSCLYILKMNRLLNARKSICSNTEPGCSVI